VPLCAFVYRVHHGHAAPVTLPAVLVFVVVALVVGRGMRTHLVSAPSLGAIQAWIESLD